MPMEVGKLKKNSTNPKYSEIGVTVITIGNTL